MSFFRSRSNANLKGASTDSSPSKGKGTANATVASNYDSTDSTASQLQPGLSASSSTNSTSDAPSTFLAVPSPRDSPERERPAGTLSKRASSALLGLRGRSPSQASLRSIKSTKSQKSAEDAAPRSSGSSSGKASSTGAGAAGTAEELPSEMTGKGWVSAQAARSPAYSQYLRRELT